MATLPLIDRSGFFKPEEFLDLTNRYGAEEIEVYDTIDPDVPLAGEHIDNINGGFIGSLGSIGIYQHEGYLSCACNSEWHDHVIIVRSAADGAIKYRVRMPDKQKRGVYRTFASAWGKNAGFDFKAIDGIFDQLTSDAKIDYAMDRLRFPEDIAEEFHVQLIEYVNKRAKAIIRKTLERDSSADLSFFSKYGIIKKRAVSGFIVQAHDLGAYQCERWLKEHT